VSTSYLNSKASQSHILDFSGAIYTSPIIIFNLSKDGPRQEPQQVTLHATPFSSRRPTLPTARTVTIARVASPISTSRIFQSQFLESLQNHFQGRPRLLKQGDVIALPLDTDESRFIRQEEDGAGADAGYDQNRFHSSYVYYNCAILPNITQLLVFVLQHPLMISCTSWSQTLNTMCYR
jgi:hypothetical protein